MSLNADFHKSYSRRYLVKKSLRFLKLWGVRRTLVKIFGRLRPQNIRFIYFRKYPKKDICVLGAGQFAFSTLCFYIASSFGNRFNLCFDPSHENSSSLFSFYRFHQRLKTKEQFFTRISTRDILFIVSNHATHAKYAIEALEKGIKRIYIEKPIAIEEEDLIKLVALQEVMEAEVFTGLNRPHSPCIQFLKKHLLTSELEAGITLSCFVLGHKIPLDHWYQNPEEGGRIHGNLIHWIDFFIHIISLRRCPKALNVSVTRLDQQADHLSMTITTPEGDIFNLVFSSRCEPLEGVTERIHLQTERTIAFVDNFKRIEIWQGEKYHTKTWRKKATGSKETVLAPLVEGSPTRSWNEVLISTLLAIELVKKQSQNSIQFNFNCANVLADFRNQVVIDKHKLIA